MSVLPKAVEELIEELGQLPGVGPRTAERYAFYLLRASPAVSKKTAEVLSNLHDKVATCPVTFMLIDEGQEVSALYESVVRDKKTVAVVEEPLDVAAIESTGAFKGTYHVLGGVVSPIDGVGPEELHIDELLTRLNKDQAEEVILATNPSVEGESTALIVQKRINEELPKVKVSRLARGLPSGVDIEYADQITLSKALEERQNL
ncbi:MAG TPA: recombination mediator RecR [Candidatus Saccharimonadales bacterium]|jgi:recombination protein RecR